VSSDLTWTNETKCLRDLKPQEDNPRKISEEQAQRLLESWDEYNQVETLAIGPDGTIYNGHQRYHTLLALGDLDMPVDVRVSSRALTKDEWRKLTVFLHRGTVGEFDFEALKGWDTGDLLAWGFEEGELGIMPSGDEWADAFGSVPDGDRAPFQQMTFTLHDSQVEQVKQALGASKGLGEFVDSPNENSNGNALARVCETFLMDYGQGEGNRTQAD